MKLISLRVSDEQYKKIEKLAKDHERSLSYVVREAIDRLKPQEVKK